MMTKKTDIESIKQSLEKQLVPLQLLTLAKLSPAQLLLLAEDEKTLPLSRDPQLWLAFLKTDDEMTQAEKEMRDSFLKDQEYTAYKNHPELRKLDYLLADEQGKKYLLANLNSIISEKVDNIFFPASVDVNAFKTRASTLIQAIISSFDDRLDLFYEVFSLNVLFKAIKDSPEGGEFLLVSITQALPYMKSQFFTLWDLITLYRNHSEVLTVDSLINLLLLQPLVKAKALQFLDRLQLPVEVRDEVLTYLARWVKLALGAEMVSNSFSKEDFYAHFYRLLTENDYALKHLPQFLSPSNSFSVNVYDHEPLRILSLAHPGFALRLLNDWNLLAKNQQQDALITAAIIKVAFTVKQFTLEVLNHPARYVIPETHLAALARKHDLFGDFEIQKLFSPNFPPLTSYFKPAIAGAIDNKCYNFISAIKKVAQTQEEYLQLLMYLLLGDSTHLERLENNPSLTSVFQAKIDIYNFLERFEMTEVIVARVSPDAGIPSPERPLTRRSRESIEKRVEIKCRLSSSEKIVAAQHMIIRIRQEYEAVSGHPLGFEANPQHFLNDPTTSKNDLFVAVILYLNIQTDPAEQVEDLVAILDVLQSKRSKVESRYQRIAGWLERDSGSIDAAKILCFDLLAVQLVDGIERNMPLNMALHTVVSTPENNRKFINWAPFDQYPLLRALVDKDFLLKYNKISVLPGKSLYLLALVHPEFLLKISQASGLLRKLSPFQLTKLAIGSESFANVLLIPRYSGVIATLDGEQLTSIAQTHSSFLSKILDKDKLLLKIPYLEAWKDEFLPKLSALLLIDPVKVMYLEDCTWLKHMKENDVVEFLCALLSMPEWIKNITPENIVNLIKDIGCFESLLIKYHEIFTKFLLTVAPKHMGFTLSSAVKLRLDARLQELLFEGLKKAGIDIHINWIIDYACASTEFVLLLLKNVDELERIDDFYLSLIINSHAHERSRQVAMEIIDNDYIKRRLQRNTIFEAFRNSDYSAHAKDSSLDFRRGVVDPECRLKILLLQHNLFSKLNINHEHLCADNLKNSVISILQAAKKTRYRRFFTNYYPDHVTEVKTLIAEIRKLPQDCAPSEIKIKVIETLISVKYDEGYKHEGSWPVVKSLFECYLLADNVMKQQVRAQSETKELAEAKSPSA